MEHLKGTLAQLVLVSFSGMSKDQFFTSQKVVSGMIQIMKQSFGPLSKVSPSHHHGYHQIVVEGDSQIILNMLTKLLHGSSPENISPIWRLLHTMDSLHNLLQPHQVLIPSHIRREANKVVDKLENIGVHWLDKDMICDSSQHSDHPIFLECNTLACMVDLSLDGVTSSS
jgi:hypothetical protein